MASDLKRTKTKKQKKKQGICFHSKGVIKISGRKKSNKDFKIFLAMFSKEIVP